MTSRITEPAPAKVNLSLHVLGRRPDGYHELDSLVVFVDCGETVSLVIGGDLSLSADGPFAGALTDDNLIAKAACLARETEPGLCLGAFHLDKRLPVAAGLGGGSADAAAALRLIGRANPDLTGAVDWQAIAERCGADVPVCLIGRAARMQGLGERVSPLTAIAPLGIVLVNPRVPLATAPVFRELAAPALVPTTWRQASGPADLSDTSRLLAFLQTARNDLEPPAMRLCPPISTVLRDLRSLPEAIVARMSGSGPTCFALAETRAAAAAMADVIARRRPDWWVSAGTIR